MGRKGGGTSSENHGEGAGPRPARAARGLAPPLRRRDRDEPRRRAAGPKSRQPPISISCGGAGIGGDVGWGHTPGVTMGRHLYRGRKHETRFGPPAGHQDLREGELLRRMTWRNLAVVPFCIRQRGEAARVAFALSMRAPRDYGAVRKRFGESGFGQNLFRGDSTWIARSLDLNGPSPGAARRAERVGALDAPSPWRRRISQRRCHIDPVALQRAEQSVSPLLLPDHHKRRRR